MSSPNHSNHLTTQSSHRRGHLSRNPPRDEDIEQIRMLLRCGDGANEMDLKKSIDVVCLAFREMRNQVEVARDNDIDSQLSMDSIVAISLLGQRISDFANDFQPRLEDRGGVEHVSGQEMPIQDIQRDMMAPGSNRRDGLGPSASQLQSSGANASVHHVHYNCIQGNYHLQYGGNPPHHQGRCATK
ncbi:hypothetical protein D9758_010309 [Tetrapyrgos nigripes]|uniref:Uncharacterized protein n=1 Tax=Tetrapyrgos nigripes TaxID=182062 RepID=A0A8H5GA75_9AGAR|nr:hypothetical protein D9758_010309 [Tetrapyrgos nigripes]